MSLEAGVHRQETIMTLSHVSHVVRSVVPSSRSVADLLQEFRAREAQENPGVVVPMSALRLTGEGTLSVPDLSGTFAFNDWSRSQLAVSIGVRWDRWFAKMPGAEQAAEVNRRFASRPER